MKLIIFDIDGTLCHSKYVDDLCFINAFKIALNIDLTEKQADWDSYKQATELGIVKEILTGLQKNDDRSAINKIIDAYTSKLSHHLDNISNGFTVVHGAKEMVEYLKKEQQFELAIATGGFLKPALFKLSKLGFDFEGVEFRSSDNFSSKSEMIKDIIRSILEKRKFETFEKVVYVGDREYDYTTSAGLGIDFIGIDFDGNGKLVNAGVTNVFNNFEPIEKILNIL